MKNAAPIISKEIFCEVLQDDKITSSDTLRIFQVLYSAPKHELSATDIAKRIGWKDKMSVNARVVGLGKRIEKNYGIFPRIRDDGSKSYWDFFFTGYFKGDFFIFQFRPKLKKALEECGLVD